MATGWFRAAFEKSCKSLALSLPDISAKKAILAATYGVVIFCIGVQGLTVKKVVEATVA